MAGNREPATGNRDGPADDSACVPSKEPPILRRT